MRKPKKAKRGKSPKANANAEVWTRYYAREKDKIDDYNRKLKEFEAGIKKREEMKKKVQKLRMKNN